MSSIFAKSGIANVLTGEEIAAAYEGQPDRNAFTNARLARLQLPNVSERLGDAAFPWTFAGKSTFQSGAEPGGPRLQVIQADGPANYSNSRASFVIQHEEDFDGNAVPTGTKVENVLLVVKDTAKGQTFSSTNSSVITGQGNRVFYDKTGDGSGQCFTASFQLGANGVDRGDDGANGYNEGGAFQALMTNIGSTNGYMSAFEGHLRDSGDDGATHWATRMTGLAAGIAKYNPTAEHAFNIHALNEGGAGSQDLDAILYADTRGFSGWKRGIDLFGDNSFTFTTLIAMQMAKTDKIRWTNGSTHTDIYANAAGRMVADAPQFLAGTVGSAAAPFYGFADDPDTGMYRSGVDQVALSAGGNVVVKAFNNNLQLNISNSGLKTVTLGDENSAGAGFRALRVAN